MTATPRTMRAVRLDIQALRAVAVAQVVVFHLTPHVLPGGYVGVDVFFVISGFLITTLLIERPPTHGAHLLDFWARRIRRLLPASLLVLAVSVAGSWAILPASQWDATVHHARAATLYVVNWTLLADAVDYLAADRAPTVVQHFWSLAVEEQFYLGWPLLILALTLLSPVARRRRTFALGLGGVVTLSLGYSVFLTATNPSAAYFSTFTRVWELGAGGLIAVAAPRLARLGADRARTAAVLGCVGWAAIAASGVILSESTPFPGWAAVLPVVGTSLVIAGHTNFRWYGLRPVHWLGDVSYSVYLWHWPLILLLPATVAKVTGAPDRGALDNVLIVVATVLLAGLSKTFVEDRFRTPRWAPRRRVTYALGATGMAGVLILCAGLGVWAAAQRDSERRDLDAALAAESPCFGAGARDRSHRCKPPRGPLVPAPALAAVDLSAAYEIQENGKNCLTGAARYLVVTCHFGDAKATTSIALVGNSHAAQWLPALERIAEVRHWRITTYLAARCATADVLLDLRTLDEATACRDWSRDVVRRVHALRPAVVIMSNRPGVPPWKVTNEREARAGYADGYRSTLAALSSSKTPILVIRDTPAPEQGGVSVPDCLAEAENWDYCSGQRHAWLQPDPAIAAAKSLPGRGIAVADFSDVFCDGKECSAAIGGVTAYIDGSHMTATFAGTLAPYLDRAIMDAIATQAN